MPATPDFRPVLARYPRDCQPDDVEFLAGGGGFSGAQLWRLVTPRGRLCLRCWPREHPTREQLRFIHAVLRHVAKQALPLVPVPLVTQAGTSFVELTGHLWQLEPWVHGRADFHDSPTPARLQAAMSALAAFHRATETFPVDEPRVTSSPGLRQRHERLHALQAGGLADLAARIDTHAGVAVAARAQRFIELFPAVAPAVDRTLADATTLAVPQQPCIRDIWHDHVFFDGDRVTGFIDFGALRVESVATDVSRLLGSLVGDDSARWHIGLAAYEALRPLATPEAKLVAAFDRANVLLGGFSWLSWCFEQGRDFDNRAGMLARLDHYLSRLEACAGGR